MNRRLRHLPAWLLRRGLQLGVFAFVIYAAFGGVWRNYKVAHNNPRLVGLIEGDAWATAYEKNENFLALFGEPYRASLDYLGMPWAATFHGLQTVDPILAFSHVLSGGAPAADVLTGASVALVVALLLGKVFCSHLCPMRLVFEVGQVIRAGLLRLRIPLPHFHSSWRFGGWVLAGGLVASLTAGMAVWLLILPYVNLVAGIFMLISSGATAGLLTVALWWAMTDLLVAPGFFCHNLCPQGFLLEKLGRFSVLRLVTTRPTKCPTKCRVCTMVRPYGLSPRTQAPPPACDNCGQCVRACPEQKLGRRLRLPVVAAALLFAGLFPGLAQAHHNKGLPHYGYYENYPQVPTQELVVVQGRWEMGASVFNFQGYERKDASDPRDVKFFIYVYDLQADANYTGEVDFEILYDGETVARFSREDVDEELIYSTRETLPQSGDYELVAHLKDAPGASPSLSFFIDLEEDSVSWSLLLALFGPLVPLFVLAALGRTRKGRAYWLRSQAPQEAEP